MNISYWISKHIRLRPKGTRGKSTGVVIAVCGVAIAVMVMEFTLCIVLGFKHSIQDKISGLESQISIGPRYLDATGATDDTIYIGRSLTNILDESLPGSARASLAVRQPVMLKTDSDFCALVLTAHAPGYDSRFERSLITRGVWPDYESDSTAGDIVVSEVTARQLGLDIGSKLDATYFIDCNVKARRYTVAGIYSADINDYDSNIAFGQFRALQRVAGFDSLCGTSIDINGLVLDSVPATVERIEDSMLGRYYNRETNWLYPVESVQQRGSMYFNWLELLNTNVTVIFILMLAVAGFTLISSMFMIVLDRIAEIGILRTLGATRTMVAGIFRRLAMRMALKGLLIGNIAGLGLMWLQKATGLLKLDQAMYYLREVPVEFDWLYLLLLNAGVLLSCWLILVLPAMAAARIDPSTTVRFE